MITNANLFERSLKAVPGGVHSPVRSFKGLHTTPRFFKRAEGAMIYDVEDKSYIDFCMSFGPLILGHKNPQVESELTEALKRGWSFGACEPYSLDLAELLLQRLPFIDQIRFVNSGTEAVMTAVRLARGFTGKDKIIKFNGCYHGHLDSMLIKAGSGLAGTATASSKGVPESVAQDTLVVDLNDLVTLEKCFQDHLDQVAAVIIEPLPANNGLLVQNLDFLKSLRKLCDQYQALLIFDEVISGMRVGFGGMAEATQIKPDLVTYGKIIGGGLPVGAVGARREIMQFLAPVGPVYQAGTLSANPLAMVAGMATLKQMTPDKYQWLEEQTLKVAAVFNEWFQAHTAFKHMKVVHSHSLFWIVPHQENLKSLKDIPSDLGSSFHDLFKIWLEKGIYLSPNAYEIGFLSMAHDDTVITELKKRLWN